MTLRSCDEPVVVSCSSQGLETGNALCRRGHFRRPLVGHVTGSRAAAASDACSDVG